MARAPGRPDTSIPSRRTGEVKTARFLPRQRATARRPVRPPPRRRARSALAVSDTRHGTGTGPPRYQHPVTKNRRGEDRKVFASTARDRAPAGQAAPAEACAKRTCREREKWCCRSELNTRPLPYQGSALPLSYGSVKGGDSSALWRETPGFARPLPDVPRRAIYRPMSTGRKGANGKRKPARPDREALARALRENLKRRKRRPQRKH